MLNIHFYNSKGNLRTDVQAEERIQNLNISHFLDDLSSCSFSTVTGDFNIGSIFYVEENQKVEYAGIITGIEVDLEKTVINSYDLRWILTKIILDEPLTLKSSDDVPAILQQLMDVAQKKLGGYPIILDSTAIQSGISLDLTFNVGDSIAFVIQKIVQTIQGRWALRTEMKDGEFLNKLVVRSIFAVTPEGVGISRNRWKSEDGQFVTLYIEEGNALMNIEALKIKQDITNTITKAKLAYQINNQTRYADYKGGDGLSDIVTDFLGFPLEAMSSDYRINSDDTAQKMLPLYNQYLIEEISVTMNPEDRTDFKCGDRIMAIIRMERFGGAEDGTALRIESLNMTRQDGFFLKGMKLTAVNPKTRQSEDNIVDTISKMKNNIDDLNKKYLSQ